MVLRLAERGHLKPERGDVVLFANTSAEHPGTYDFTAKCTELLEQEYALPVFWYEFCTVEDAVGGVYKRKRTYRLVKPVPIEDDPHGYRSRGEVFEEMLSFQSMLPNPHSRSCTAKLKLHPGHALLAEWFSNSDGPAHEGHRKGKSYLNLEATAQTYLQNGGTASAKDYIKSKRYLQSVPTARPKQFWGDFTEAPVSDSRQTAPPLNTPSDINWWSQIERRYRREVPARNGNGISKFGFLGVSGPSYAQIAANNAPIRNRYSQGTPACDCTD